MTKERITHEVPYLFFSAKKPKTEPWEETVELPDTWPELYRIKGSFPQYGSNNLDETFTVDYGPCLRFTAEWSCMNEEYVVTLLQLTCDYRRRDAWQYEEVESWYPKDEKGIALAIICALDALNDELGTGFRMELTEEED